MVSREERKMVWVKAKALRLAAFAAVLAVLAACGGGGGGGASVAPPPGETELEQVRSDPRVARLGEILSRADALLLTGLRIRYSLEGGGVTLADETHETFSCAGARCVSAGGEAVTAADLSGSTDDLEVRLSEVGLGERGGFDTAATRGRYEITEVAGSVTITVGPTAHAYGFWGEHGYAALELGSGPVSGATGGTAVTGDFAFARAYAAGAASGTNPAGAGSATWRGIVEASPTASFARLTGAVTLTIADLSRPRVGVEIDVPGHAVGPAGGWSGLPLANGRFSTGTQGRDYLEGHFGGPGHEEAWGVFDTTGYLGAFGAKRQP